MSGPVHGQPGLDLHPGDARTVATVTSARWRPRAYGRSARGGSALRCVTAARPAAPRRPGAGPRGTWAAVSPGAAAGVTGLSSAAAASGPYRGGVLPLPPRPPATSSPPRPAATGRAQPYHSSVRLIAGPVAAAVAVQPRLILGVAAHEGGIVLENTSARSAASRGGVRYHADPQAQLPGLLAGDGPPLPDEPRHVDESRHLRPSRGRDDAAERRV